MISQRLQAEQRAQPQNGICPIRLDSVLASYRLRTFYGDLHTHTSFSDGVGQPADALRQMRERGMHFAAITDHGEWIDRDPAAWATIGQQVAAANTSDFVAIRGFEWSSPLLGHCNVWDAASYTGFTRTGDTMENFYTWLACAQSTNGAPVFAGFNHPGREQGRFNEFAYVPAIRNQMATVECFNRQDDYGAGYFQALDAGWYVGPVGNSDHHANDWGGATLARTGVLAEKLTREHILSALRTRRVFATRSPSLTLLLSGNGMLMGSQLALRVGEPLLLDVWSYDPLANNETMRVECWTNSGKLVDAREVHGVRQFAWTVPVTEIGPQERWFAVRLVCDNVTVAYSSPIWARQG